MQIKDVFFLIFKQLQRLEITELKVLFIDYKKHPSNLKFYQRITKIPHNNFLLYATQWLLRLALYFLSIFISIVRNKEDKAYKVILAFLVFRFSNWYSPLSQDHPSITSSLMTKKNLFNCHYIGHCIFNSRGCSVYSYFLLLLLMGYFILLLLNYRTIRVLHWYKKPGFMTVYKASGKETEKVKI